MFHLWVPLASLLLVALAQSIGAHAEQPGSCAGIPGIPGQHGAPGRDGRDGERGLIGPKGEAGTHGSKGEQGSKGDKGDKAVTPKSAFTAKLSFSNPPVGSPIKFNVIISNDQGHYDPWSGKFTCVHPGTYYFVLHVHLYKHTVCVALHKNELKVVSFCSDSIEGKYAYGMSGGSLLSLKEGDQVWLQVVDNYNELFYQDPYRDSTFTGFLLFPE